jgi:hypothetical protein
MDPSEDKSDLSIVRVLERAWHVEAIRDCPAPGGEPPVVTFLVELNPKTNIARSSATCQSGSPPRVGNKNAFSTGHTFRGRRSGPVWPILRRIYLRLFLPSSRLFADPFAVKECIRADKLSAVFLRAVWFVDRDAKRSFVGGRIHRSRRSVPLWCEPATRYRLTWLPGDLES